MILQSKNLFCSAQVFLVVGALLPLALRKTSLPLLYPSLLQCHFLCSISSCLLFPTDILLLCFFSLIPGDTWVEVLPRDQRRQCYAFFYLRDRVRSSGHPKPAWDKPPKAENSKIAGIQSGYMRIEENRKYMLSC